jgi:hypothetical protein
MAKARASLKGSHPISGTWSKQDCVRMLGTRSLEQEPYYSTEVPSYIWFSLKIEPLDSTGVPVPGPGNGPS